MLLSEPGTIGTREGWSQQVGQMSPVTLSTSRPYADLAGYSESKNRISYLKIIAGILGSKNETESADENVKEETC